MTDTAMNTEENHTPQPDRTPERSRYPLEAGSGVRAMRVKTLEWNDIGYGVSAECAFGQYIVERNAHIDGRAGLIYPENAGNTFPHDFFGTEKECQDHAASDLLTRASALFERGDHLRDAAMLLRTPDEFELLLGHIEKADGSLREKLDTALKAVADHGYDEAVS